MSFFPRLSLLLAIASTASAQPAPVQWSPFVFTSFAGDTASADSGRVTVPERHGQPNGSKIQIAVVRIRSTAARPGVPIVYFAGGPGGAGISGTRGDLFPTVLALRALGDVILFDQRGTGQTLPSLFVRQTLGIPLGMSSGSPEALALLVEHSRAVAAEVRARGVDLGAYNTNENADDVDDVRAALGVPRWIVWGHSYGSHLGLAYLRRHGDRVERAILGGINGPDHRRRYPKDGDVLLGRVDSIVRTSPSLRAAMPDFLGSTRRVLDRLAAQPATARVDSQDVLVSREDVQAVIALQSGDATFVRRLPWMIGRMEAGDYSFIARLVRDGLKARPFGTAMTYPMDLASGVSEARARRIRAEAPTALLGNAINYPFDEPAFKAAWGATDLGPAFRAPVRSTVPTLFISGTLDGRTSLGDADEVRKGFRTSAHLVVDGSSHNPYIMHPAVQRLMVRFAQGERLRDTTVRALNVELRGPDETALVAELRDVAAKEGGEAAGRRLRALAAAGSGHHVTSFVVSAVFGALASVDARAAEALLRVGVELFPTSTVLLTRLAEVEAARGDRGAAAAAYRRALEADPYNRPAATALAKLGAA